MKGSKYYRMTCEGIDESSFNLKQPKAKAELIWWKNLRCVEK